MHMLQAPASPVCTPSRTIGSTCVVFFFCVCVLFQMLGAPITLFSLLNSPDMLMESVSEDFSLTPSVPEPGAPNLARIHTELEPSHHFAVFETSVFHPPQS